MLDISATSSSRMKDDYTSSRMQDIYITCYYVATVLLLLLRRRYREQVFTQELPLMEMEVAEELPLNTGMKIAKELSLSMRMEATKELPLNMETKVTMEPRWEDRRGEKEIKRSRNYVTLLLLCA